MAFVFGTRACVNGRRALRRVGSCDEEARTESGRLVRACKSGRARNVTAHRVRTGVRASAGSSSSAIEVGRTRESSSTAELLELAEDVVRWLEENGVDTSGVAVKSERVEGSVELSAAQTARPDADLLVVPLSLCITADSARSALGSAVGSLRDEPSPGQQEILIALQLLAELSKGDASQFAPFIRRLTADGVRTSLPMAWTRGEITLLRGSPSYRAALDMKHSVTEEYELLRETVFADSPSVFDEDTCSLDAYIWAKGVTLSQAVHLPSPVNGPALVPLATEVQFEQGATGSSNAAISITRVGWRREPHACVRSTKSIESKDVALYKRFPESLQIATDQLLNLGFVSASAAVDCVELTFGISQLDPFADDKADILAQQKLGEEVGFRVFSDEVLDVTKDMLQLARLISVTALDAFLLEAVFRGDVWDFMSLPVSADNELAACEMIKVACEASLEEYIDDGDEEDAVTDSSGEKAQFARRVVSGEKAILRDVIQAIEEEISAIDAKEYYQDRRLRELDLLRPVDESEIVDSDGTRRAGQAFDDYY